MSALTSKGSKMVLHFSLPLIVVYFYEVNCSPVNLLTLDFSLTGSPKHRLKQVSDNGSMKSTLIRLNVRGRHLLKSILQSILTKRNGEGDELKLRHVCVCEQRLK